MRFRVTSVTSTEAGERVNAVTTRIEDWLNSALGDGDFGGHLDQVTFVVVAVDDDPGENAKFGGDRLVTLRSPISGDRTRNLRFSLLASPSEVLALSEPALFAKVAELAIDKLARRPKRLPRGFDYSRCATATRAAFGAYVPTAA